MGLLSWLFPSDDERMNKAEARLAQGEFALARDMVESIEGARAADLLRRAHAGLLSMNIEVALGYARAGDFDRAREHMSLAEEFAQPGDPELRGARRALREAREGLKAPGDRKTLGVANTAFDGVVGAPDATAGAGVA